jgi:predicted esterase
MAHLTRRACGATIAGALLGACTGGAQTGAARVKIHTSPGKGTGLPNPGTYPLKLRPQRDALLYVPGSLPAGQPAPLIVFLHGASGNEERGLRFLSAYADEFRFLLLAPASEDGTWDAIQGAFGPDVQFIDRALDRVFAMCRIDPKKIALSGFSDGASYALGLGLSNGHLFGSVMAFSPGFVPSRTQPDGRPRFFVSHGTEDRILPIEQCSRRLVPRLKAAGYEVEYREFDGPHTLPARDG